MLATCKRGEFTTKRHVKLPLEGTTDIWIVFTFSFILGGIYRMHHCLVNHLQWFHSIFHFKSVYAKKNHFKNIFTQSKWMDFILIRISRQIMATLIHSPIHCGQLEYGSLNVKITFETFLFSFGIVFVYWNWLKRRINVDRNDCFCHVCQICIHISEWFAELQLDLWGMTHWMGTIDDHWFSKLCFFR